MTFRYEVRQVQPCVFCEFALENLAAPDATPEDFFLYRMHYAEIHGVEI